MLPLRSRLLRRCTNEDRGYESLCVIWHGEKDRDGYGRIKRDGRRIPAHWVLKGDPPAGFEVDHLCRQRDCVRPDHLEHVTRAENLRRRQVPGPRDFSDT
jgi:hypothetical protein